MTTFVRSSEAAQILGVTPATLYAYVSRGRVTRRLASDGRTSLYDRDELERLAASQPRRGSTPRPSIDVRITTDVSQLSETGVTVRGVALDELARTATFEQVVELLGTGRLPSTPPEWKRPPSATIDVARAVASLPGVTPIGRLAALALALADHAGTARPADAARLLLQLTPIVCGESSDAWTNSPAAASARSPNATLAARLVRCWLPGRETDAALVDAIDATLVLLSEHELATSTLGARVAASTRASAISALAAGLTVIDGPLHGTMSADVVTLLDACAADGVDVTMRTIRLERRSIPGFGHKIYRSIDPRLPPLLDRVLPLATDEQAATVHEVMRWGSVVSGVEPNIDLGLGALLWFTGLDPAAPLFAIARIAGLAAHVAEELEAPPLRFRGLARPSE